jgi:hypothetical protein
MQWSTSNSINQNGMLMSNGPYRILTTGSPFIGVQRPQVVQLIKSISVGEVKTYGAAPAKEDNTEKGDTMDAK